MKQILKWEDCCNGGLSFCKLVANYEVNRDTLCDTVVYTGIHEGNEFK